MTKNSFRTYIITAYAGTVFAVTACVPIPYATRAYVANGADVTLKQSGGSGCGLGSDTYTSGHRQMGPVRMTVNLISENAKSANPTAKLQFSFIQQPSQSRPLSVSVNPTRVKLQESGRTLTANLEIKYGHDFDGGMRGDYVSLTFAPPSGVNDNVRIEFEPGAIRIGGRSVASAPIRYKLSENFAVYVFPCIPT